MGAVHIRVSHDDNLVVAQFFHVEIFPDSRSQGGNKVANPFIGKDLIKTGFFHIDNFAAQREHGLEMPVPSLLGRSAG